MHLLTLDADDRYARFGYSIGDEALLEWVRCMDWRRLQWWGIWCPLGSGLLGVLQLSQTNTEGVCELAMSVRAQVRRRGLATSLLSCAVRQSPAVERLVCLHGHEAVRSMARRIGWHCEMMQDAGWRIDVTRSFFVAGPPQDKNGPLGGQRTMRSREAWGHF